MPADPDGLTRDPPAASPLLPRRRPAPPLLLIAGAMIILAAATLFFVNPTATRLYPPCPLRAATGLHCPGCGSTRALHHLLHGRLATAFDFNPLLVASLPFLLYAAARRLRPPRRPSRPLPPWSIWALLTLVLTFGVLRNLPHPAVRWMAP